MNTVDMEQKTVSEYNGHAYVDMGLSVMWATCNVGASSPEEYGDYYAWGETEAMSRYDADNCETWNKRIGDIGGTSRDVAHVKWGGSWRMPTEAEFGELLDENKCTWTGTTKNGVDGYKVTSKKTGDSIFLPAAWCRDGGSLGRMCEHGSYWGSTPHPYSSQGAVELYFDGFHRNTYWCDRKYGRSVRPVAE